MFSAYFYSAAMQSRLMPQNIIYRLHSLKDVSIGVYSLLELLKNYLARHPLMRMLIPCIVKRLVIRRPRAMSIWKTFAYFYSFLCCKWTMFPHTVPPVGTSCVDYPAAIYCPGLSMGKRRASNSLTSSPKRLNHPRKKRLVAQQVRNGRKSMADEN